MSAITLSESRLIQRVGDQEEELGRIELDANSNTYVLWLKDTFGVANTAGTYIRADEYPSMAVARAEALNAPSVFIWHLIWMRGLVKLEAERVLDDHWEEISEGFECVLEKESLKDRIRALIDRLPVEEVKELFKNVGTSALVQVIAKLVERLLTGG